jgi:hypothetical protein
LSTPDLCGKLTLAELIKWKSELTASVKIAKKVKRDDKPCKVPSNASEMNWAAARKKDGLNKKRHRASASRLKRIFWGRFSRHEYRISTGALSRSMADEHLDILAVRGFDGTHIVEHVERF